jgi:signal transduction histidine kinase/FixJ family two-component response regulator
MATASRTRGLAHYWLNLPLSRKGGAIIALPVLCMLCMLGILAHLQRRAVEADQWVVHTAEVLGQSSEILADSLSLEATVRGYILTREPAFLALHHRSRGRLFDAFSRVLALTADNPRQQDRMRQAMSIMHEETGVLDAQLALPVMPMLTASVNASRSRIDGLRAVIDDFDKEERRLLEVRQVSRVVHRGQIRTALLTCLFLGLISGIAGARLFAGAVKRRLEQIAENAARFARRESDGPIDGSTDTIGQLEAALIATSRDVLDREDRLARNAAELERAKTHAELAVQAKSDFIATVSHEIRSPMNALLGAAEMLQSTALTESQSEYVTLLNRAGNTLLSTVNEVLDHAKIEAGQFELDSMPFDCAAAVNRVVDLLSMSASAKGLDLLAKYTPETPRHVVGDAARLQRVLMNLVNNAIKFTETGIVAIRVEPAEEPGMLHFAVADTGIGIPRDRQDAIFQKYIQAGISTSRVYGGTGLGLAICKHIVDLMGGRIWVESDAGEGSTFHFTASLAPAPAPADAAPLRAERPAVLRNGAPAPSKRLGARILLAEDAASNIALIKAYLSGSGCQLDIATDGVSALEQLTRGHYNLALMDVQMPGLDGYEVTRRFRDWERANRRPRTPIISVTAHAFQEDVEEAIKSGADAHLTKPFRRDSLLDAIEIYQRPDGGSEIRVAVPDFIRELAPEFLRRQRSGLITVWSALKNGEFDPIQSFAHNMKGCGKSFGFPLLTDLGREMESAAKQRDAGTLHKKIEDLREYLTVVDVER